MIEQKRDGSFIGTCESCHKENVRVRMLEALIVVNGGQGFFNICFECFAIGDKR